MERKELGTFVYEGNEFVVTESTENNNVICRTYTIENPTETKIVNVYATSITCIHTKRMEWGWDRKYVDYELELVYGRGEVKEVFVIAKIDYNRYEVSANDCGELDTAMQSVKEILYRSHNETWFLQSNLKLIELCTSKIDELIGNKPDFKEEDDEQLPF